ncbi:response regulator transcription factor [Phaeobacter inhibens]|uniref:response regulator transcription factor n=1 Tax=Phaeobacter inhibens TaxID=221822 RepID=UPI0018DBFA36|nr:response regulator transcription factor [Phaeobacter inhibens]
MKRLLIADDHLMIGSAMVYLLKQLDPSIHTVSVGSAKAALKTVAEGNPFDLVLLDYDMPGTNGIKGMGLIHKDHPEQTVGIISGRTEPQLVKAAIAAGAVGWLPKSMSDEPLLHALRMMAAGGQFVPTDVLAELKSSDDRWDIFSEAEQRVAKQLAQGLSDKEIALGLGLEPKTVRNHVRNILRKTGAESRTKFALSFHENR